ncbi:sigma factor-like helix-turn-helix DNA-binding protein [Sphingomonas sp. BIUV-7]|uniref:Sigma factor-like helix-turn-helix DNA-binding protein n=1 Tax=Sphingomonas natans TaxID=3063330 RepID=A0ABT8YCP5_9SPHN|nr:sigma factor-like helix-turn-helix DNA-binding protein [Sphingomonas sp. BIUV-7]MDO6416093.1 sigma factor-like helix-turn-helix DNA-binding protein [Sphingomonas sp. BIUV-7]
MSESSDLLWRMEAIMASLDPLTRNVFLAHRLDDLPYGNIAAALDISIADVERRMAKAIYTLAKELDEAEKRPSR